MFLACVQTSNISYYSPSCSHNLTKKSAPWVIRQTIQELPLSLMVQSPMARAIRLLLMAPARLVQVLHFEIYKYVAFWVVRTRSAMNKCFK